MGDIADYHVENFSSGRWASGPYEKGKRMANNQSTKLVKINDARHCIVTPVMQISFPKVFKAVWNELSKKNEFSCDLIAQEEDDLKQDYKGKKKQTLSIRKAVFNARVDQWGPKEKWPKWTFETIKTGNNQKNKDGEVYAGYADRLYITAKSGEEYPPKIVGADGKPLDPKEMYGGAMVRAALIARPVHFGKTIGVRFILQQLIKVGDGERFGGGGMQDVFDVEEMGGDDDGGAEGWED